VLELLHAEEIIAEGIFHLAEATGLAQPIVAFDNNGGTVDTRPDTGHGIHPIGLFFFDDGIN